MPEPRTPDAPAAPTGERAPARTRERILRAAIALFSRGGYDGVSVDAIVARAGVNKRMVYHYFSNKNGLYTAALESVFGRLAGVEAEVFSDDPQPEVALERIVSAYFHFLRDTPEFVSLLLWENLQGGRHLKALPAAVTKAPLLEALGRSIERGMAAGRIRSDLDPRQMLILLIGLCQVYFSNRHTLARTVGLDPGDPAVLEAGVRHALLLIRDGFFTHPNTHASKDRS